MRSHITEFDNTVCLSAYSEEEAPVGTPYKTPTGVNIMLDMDPEDINPVADYFLVKDKTPLPEQERDDAVRELICNTDRFAERKFAKVIMAWSHDEGQSLIVEARDPGLTSYEFKKYCDSTNTYKHMCAEAFGNFCRVIRDAATNNAQATATQPQEP